jgi:hypothetical protein
MENECVLVGRCSAEILKWRLADKMGRQAPIDVLGVQGFNVATGTVTRINCRVFKPAQLYVMLVGEKGNGSDVTRQVDDLK